MIELALTSMFLFTSFYGGEGLDGSEAIGKPGAAQAVNSVHAFGNKSEREVNPVKKHPLTFEEYVREYFKDTPILAEIARCESTFRHFRPNGEVLRGIQNNSDVGVMQINLFYHGDTAVKNGFDLYSLEGNMSYAKWLYEKQGTRPWVHSSRCWGPKAERLAMNK